MSSPEADLTKAVVVHPAEGRSAFGRTPEAKLEEAAGLARAIDLDVVAAIIAPVQRPVPATFLGGGKVAEIAELLDGADPRPGLVIVDRALSPVQHRNLERAWNAKVLDRTALILEIFGERARTAEGRLQVDLAHYTYQRSRLVRSWTHLERQRGGAGFLGGPGERQIEADRRALARKIDRIKEKLEDVRRTRTLQRRKRKRAPYPVVALVGYTNAGKSTLFNRMTASSVEARDLLFATLDPAMRAVDLSSGQRIILSDTVGFISDLPTHLVAAFRATLEEVLEADIVIHVRDAAHPDTEAQRADVVSVLEAIGLTEEDDRPVIEALNKIDLLPEDERASLAVSARFSLADGPPGLAAPARVAISAVTGEGVGELEALIDALATADRRTYVVDLPAEAGAARAWLYRSGAVESEASEDGAARLVVRLSDKSRGQFERAFPQGRLREAGGEDLRWRA